MDLRLVDPLEKVQLCLQAPFCRHDSVERIPDCSINARRSVKTHVKYTWSKTAPNPIDRLLSCRMVRQTLDDRNCVSS